MKDKTYEELFNELKEIIADLQDENKTLDESIENFKKGVKLHEACKSKLEQANEEIVKIIGDEDEK